MKKTIMKRISVDLLVSLNLLCVLLLDCTAAQNCDSKETCSECIQELGCFWCVSPKQNESLHCLLSSQTTLCDTIYTENPQKSFEVFGKTTSDKQINPQKVKLKLRKNEKYVIDFKYTQSADYPVDLYYIMDLSHSMEASKNTLAKLGGKLATEMQNKTKNFQIGFGSFVDKLTLPYVNTEPNALKSPCGGCAAPYSFINHLSLMQDASKFSREVHNTRMSGNLDTPEGGLDAIMQAMVCTEEIGWRPNARHLLVMSTDAVSHIAGDGKLGGVIEPNDGTCHMKNHQYTAGLIYDYPSVSHINYVARQNNIHIIFAIVLKSDFEHITTHYKAVSSMIENSKMGTLQGNSENIVHFISEIYDKIRDSVRITSNATAKDVMVNITSTCSGFRDGSCAKVKPGEVIDFRAIIEPLECSDNPKLNKKIIQIKPEGLKDSLVVELEVLCDCDCASKKQKNHTSCSGLGDLECGICKCGTDRFGAQCQCNWKDSKGEDPSLCMRPDGNNEICSGQGTCICGKCRCKQRPDKSELIYGNYCQCDNFTCPQKCSGRGTCKCGKCECDEDWGGVGCDCKLDDSSCKAPGETELCSGHGKCVCGQCVCKENEEERYSGEFCQKCTNCPDQRCEELKPCVQCQAYDTGPYANKTDCVDKCLKVKTEKVKKLRGDVERAKCRVLVKNSCVIEFEYNDSDEKLIKVQAEEREICPDMPPIFMYILSVVGAVLFIGIITLIAWKIATTFHDKSEYARFMKEKDNTKWSRSENPLYKPGTSHFENPAYKRASQRGSIAVPQQTISKR